MMRSIRRRIDLLADQVGGTSRMITLNIADRHVQDSALIDATLAAAGIEREEQDLVVLLKRYGTLGTEPPCSLVSVQPMPSNARKTL